MRVRPLKPVGQPGALRTLSYPGDQVFWSAHMRKTDTQGADLDWLAGSHKENSAAARCVRQAAALIQYAGGTPHANSLDTTSLKLSAEPSRLKLLTTFRTNGANRTFLPQCPHHALHLTAGKFAVLRRQFYLCATRVNAAKRFVRRARSSNSTTEATCIFSRIRAR